MRVIGFVVIGLLVFAGCASSEEADSDEGFYDASLKPEEHRHRAQIALEKLLAKEQELEKAESKSMREYLGWEINRYKKEFEYYFKQAEKGIPDDPQLVMLDGAYLMWQKKYEAAIERFNRLINRKINDASVYLNLALCYDALGDIDKAYENCAKALEIDPRFSRAARYIVELEQKKQEKQLLKEK